MRRKKRNVVENIDEGKKGKENKGREQKEKENKDRKCEERKEKCGEIKLNVGNIVKKRGGQEKKMP